MSKRTRVLDTARGRVADLQVEVVNGDGTYAVLALASSAEAAAGTSEELAVTPKGLADLAAGFVPAASTTVQGKVELATDAEVQTGTDTGRVVTPAGLAACTSTDARKGVVELATDSEAIAVTDAARAVTPHGLGAALAKLFVISFTGSNLAGACTATGVAVNDVLFGVAGLTEVGQVDSKFEAVVSVVNQIQQSAAEDLSTKNFLALVYRPS
jgi:hypothetical protein